MTMTQPNERKKEMVRSCFFCKGDIQIKYTEATKDRAAEYLEAFSSGHTQCATFPLQDNPDKLTKK